MASVVHRGADVTTDDRGARHRAESSAGTHLYDSLCPLCDDRGAAALAERLRNVERNRPGGAYPHLGNEADRANLTAAILGERGRFLPDTGSFDLLLSPAMPVAAELARLRRIEAAARAYADELARLRRIEAAARAYADEWSTTEVIGWDKRVRERLAALRAAYS
jgi:hypothetical protein